MTRTGGRRRFGALGAVLVLWVSLFAGAPAASAASVAPTADAAVQAAASHSAVGGRAASDSVHLAAARIAQPESGRARGATVDYAVDAAVWAMPASRAGSADESITSARPDSGATSGGRSPPAAPSV